MEYTTIQKQKQSSEVQIEQVKTQLEFVINKKYNDPDITSMKATLIDKQNEAADLHKKFIEITTKIRFETASYKDLKKKIENDDAKIAKLRIQYELAERQLVQAEMRHDKEVKEKDRLMAELKDIKEAVYIRDSSNKALQKDVNNMRVKYNDAIINNNDIHQKLNKLRTEIINESMEMKRLQDTIDKLRTTNCIN
jgi:chromosome segregation ATPase